MRVMLIFIAIIFSINLPACENDIFSQHPVENIYNGKFFELKYNENEMSLEYYKATKEALSKGVGFAGSYVIVMIPIEGMKALVGLVVNVETGEDYQLPRPYERSDQLTLDVQYRKNSSVICISNSWKHKNIKEKPECYNFSNGEFVPIECFNDLR